MTEEDNARGSDSSTTVTKDLLDEPATVWNKVKGGIEVEENKVKSGGWEASAGAAMIMSTDSLVWLRTTACSSSCDATLQVDRNAARAKEAIASVRCLFESIDVVANFWTASTEHDHLAYNTP